MHEGLEEWRQKVIEIVGRCAHDLAREEGHGVLVKIENAVELAQGFDDGGRCLLDRSLGADRDDREAGRALVHRLQLRDQALEHLRIAAGGLGAEQDRR